MKQVTVKQLLILCQEEVEKGNGDKNIVISDDNEGNGYHGLFYGFTPVKEDGDEYGFEDAIYDSWSTDNEHTIVLG